MFVLGSVDNPRSFVSSPIPSGSVSIAIPQARAIATALRDNRDTISALVATSIDSVMREYPAFQSARSHNPAAFARQAVVMSILSPQLLFRHNLELAQNFCAELPMIETLSNVQSALRYTLADGSTSTRFNGWITKSLYLFEALPYLRSIRDTSDVTRDSLLALRGFGPKTIAFALHMIDWNADVFTLDVHMLRVFSQVAGLPIAGNMNISRAAYRDLECALIEFMRAQFPTYPLFAIQWAIWDCAYGYHVEHDSLFG